MGGSRPTPNRRVLRMDQRAEYESLYRQLMELNDRAAEPEEKSDAAMQCAAAVTTSALTAKLRSPLLFTCSSIVLNCAFELKDSSTISLGKELGEQALTGAQRPTSHCTSNVATTSRMH
jgi:hypothetical protein